MRTENKIKLVDKSNSLHKWYAVTIVAVGYVCFLVAIGAVR